MKTGKQAGMTGKGFYVALSLCVAMVGAACWYAYTESDPPNLSSQAEHSTPSSQTTTGTTTTPVATSATSTTWRTSRTRTTTTTPATQQAAAILTKSTTTQTTTTQTVTTTAPVERPIKPLDGAVIQPFSHGELVKSPTTGIWQTHNGVDLAAALGTEVCCAADGTVTAIDRDALWGICVTVQHTDGTVTRYCGLNEGLTVTAGQVLERGDVLGAVGATAEAESGLEPHLHFEVLQNDCYVDPETYWQDLPQPETQTQAVTE